MPLGPKGCQTQGGAVGTLWVHVAETGAQTTIFTTSRGVVKMVKMVKMGTMGKDGRGASGIASPRGA